MTTIVSRGKASANKAFIRAESGTSGSVKPWWRDLFAKMVYVVIAGVTSLLAVAASNGIANNAGASPAVVEDADAEDGPNVHIPGRGRIAIVNACSTASPALDAAAKRMASILSVEFVIKDGKWTFESWRNDVKTTGAEVAVFVAEDNKMPMSLISMEDKWAVVNVTGLSDDQLRKEIVRVTMILLGAANSRYPASPLHPVFVPSDLDKVGDVITFDSLQKIHPQLDAYGLTTSQDMSYRDACREGKAPPPRTPNEQKIAGEVAAEKK